VPPKAFRRAGQPAEICQELFLVLRVPWYQYFRNNLTGHTRSGAPSTTTSTIMSTPQSGKKAWNAKVGTCSLLLSNALGGTMTRPVRGQGRRWSGWWRTTEGAQGKLRAVVGDAAALSHHFKLDRVFRGEGEVGRKVGPTITET
jgi:hypothetical protein